jgi:hypothetical protein
VLAGHVTATLVTVAGRELVRDGQVTVVQPEWQMRQDATGERLREWRRAGAS